MKAALILAVVTIFLAVYDSHSSSKIEIIEANPIVLDINGSENSYLDVKLKNVGDQVALINGVDVEVIEASINLTPILNYHRKINISENLITIYLYNKGWGPALNTSFVDFYQGLDAANQLGIERTDLTWNGTVKGCQIIKFSYQMGKTLKNVSLIGARNYYGPNSTEVNPIARITYNDNKARLYDHMLDNFNDDGGCDDYFRIFKINESTILYSYDVLCYSRMAITNIYNAGDAGEKLIINPNDFDPNRLSTFKQDLRIAQEVPPNTADRFLIKIDTPQSAEYKLKIILHYDRKSTEYIIYNVNLIKHPKLNFPEEYYFN